MNHQLAVETKATERYMLGELDDESRSAFEEHYFSCRACADDVKVAAVFVDNAKAVLQSPRAGGRSEGKALLFMPRPALLIPAAMAACLVVGFFLPRRAPAGSSFGGVVASVAIPAGTRGAQAAGQAILVDKETSYFQVRLDVADDVTESRLSWRVRTAGGQELRFQTARENQVVLPLHAADFPAGQYEVILSRDSPGPNVIDRYPFTIQLR